MHTCPDCKRELPEESFGLRTSKQNVKRYRRSYCPDCKRTRDKQWREQNPKKFLQHRINYARKQLDKLEQQLAQM